MIPPDWTSYWAQLKALFKAINEGSPPIDVYEYNGGLFDPSQHEFLMQYEIGDSYLARAIDLLARAESEQEKRRDFVDYRDLAIQHLGSIYEGLLEHKPRVADEEMVDLPPQRESSLMLDWGLRKGALNGQEVLRTGTNHQQAPRG